MKTPTKIVLAIVGVCTIFAIAQFYFISDGQGSGKEKTKKQKKTVAQVTAETNNLSTFTGLLKTAGLDTTISGEGSYTVFAPTDDAFAALTEAEYTDLVNEDNKAALKEIVSGHLVRKAINQYDLEDMDAVKSLNGTQLRISAMDDTLYINDAAIIGDNIPASNGVLYKIDKVLNSSSGKVEKEEEQEMK